MKKRFLLSSLLLGAFIFSCVGCNSNNGGSNYKNSSTNSIFEEENLDDVSLNSIGEMNYYLGKTFTMNKNNPNKMKKAYKNVQNALKKYNLATEPNENPEEYTFEDNLDALPEGLEEPSHGEKEIDYITFNYDIYYKDGSIAYFKDINNYTISYCISFRFLLEDENTYLAKRIGTGTIYCVITDFGISTATFRNGDKFCSCCPDGGDPGIITDDIIFNFGREYVGMYFFKGEKGTDGEYRGNILFHNLNDISKAYVRINEDGKDKFPLMDYEYSTVTRFEPITLTWEEYCDYVIGKLRDNEDISPEELKNRIRNQWEERLNFDNATFLVKDPEFGKSLYYFIDGKYYKDDNGVITEEICDHKEYVIGSILGNLESLVTISENYFHLNEMDVALDNGTLKSITINSGIRYYVYNFGTTVLPK